MYLCKKILLKCSYMHILFPPFFFAEREYYWNRTDVFPKLWSGDETDALYGLNLVCSMPGVQNNGQWHQSRHINPGILRASLCNSLTKLFLSPLSINWKTYNLWRNIFTIITEKYLILKVNPFLQPSLCWCGFFFFKIYSIIIVTFSAYEEKWIYV